MISATVICKDNLVTGVNCPGDGSYDAYTVANGDSITYTVYEPSTTQIAEAPAGSRYNMFMLTSGDGTKSQAFMIWSPEDPVWQDKLSKTNTVVRGIGVPGPNTLKSGDRYTISVQEGANGAIDVTIDAWRDNKAVCTFSFLVAQ
ncbi:MAG: hypothetical protein AAGF93_07310 [Cyanobacteria bacterium P01_H01_bin.105]